MSVKTVQNFKISSANRQDLLLKQLTEEDQKISSFAQPLFSDEKRYLDPRVCQRALTELEVIPRQRSYNNRFKMEFIRRVRGDNRQQILSKVHALGPGPIHKDILEAFRFGNWDHPIFKQDHWPTIAMKAYLEGEIDDYQASKLFLYESSLKEGGQLTKRSFNQDEINDNDLDFIINGFELGNDPEFKDRLRKDIAKLPKGDRQFFTIETDSLSTEQLQRRMSKNDLKFANTAQFTPIPGIFINLDNKIVQTVLPPLLWQTVMNARYGKQAMHMKPALGYFKLEKLSDPASRVATVPSSLVALPNRIHSFVNIEKGPGIYVHDANYHLCIESANPHRAIWIEIADYFKDKYCSKEVQEAYADLLDREFLPYLEKKTKGRYLEGDADFFWHALAFFPRASRKNFSDDDWKGILHFIAKKAPEWKEKYGVDFSHASLIESHERNKEVGNDKLKRFVQLHPQSSFLQRR